jgi:hypothetical protein
MRLLLLAWFWVDCSFILKLTIMAIKDRSIGSTGLEQGGPNLGNDYSRDITREHQEDDSLKVVVPKNKKDQDADEDEQPEKEKTNQ